MSAAEGQSKRPASPTMAAKQLLSLPPRWLHMYDDYVAKNAGQIAQLESALRSLTYILPGRFRDSEIASETLHSTVQLLSMYHDSLLVRAISPRTSPASTDSTAPSSSSSTSPAPSSRSNATTAVSPSPSPHARYTRYWARRSALYRRVAVLLQTVRYTELLCEMAAKRRGGDGLRWNVVVFLEGVKAVCRLLLLWITSARSIISPALPERPPVIPDEERPPDNDDNDDTAEGSSVVDGMSSIEALRELVGDDESTLAFGTDLNAPSSSSTSWRGGKPPFQHPWQMPRTGMSLPSLPSPGDVGGYLLSRVLTADDVRPATRLLRQLRGSAQAAEVLHILAPLLYALALRHSARRGTTGKNGKSGGSRGWAPWLLGLSAELAARQLRDKTSLRATTLEREEWGRRGWAMGWWAMRGPLYDNVVKGVVGGVRRRMPGLVAGIIEDYEYLWENYYFSTSD